ncbi:MAG: xanthine dehydrogenase family protein molybdopterin-binding subunit [Chloroflexota bacterium]
MSQSNGLNGSNGSVKSEFKYVGKPRPIIDGKEKVTGHAKYAGDLHFPGMLHLRPILAQQANGIITRIDKAAAEALPGVVGVFTAEDLPTKDALINSRNNAVLAKERTLWVGQPVAVVVAESEAIASDAADLVMVYVDAQPVVTDVMEAIQPDAPKVWPDGYPTAADDLSALHGNTAVGDAAGDDDFNNLNSKNQFARGDVEQGFAESDVIVEQRYRVASVHQAYMEPHACVVEPTPFGGLNVYTSTQNMFAVRGSLASLLGLPIHDIVVKPAVFGGGFGAKYGIYEPLAAAVAMMVKRPCKLVMSRSDDFLSSTPAPEIVIDVKTGAKNDGTVTAVEASVYTNNGVFSFNHGGMIAGPLGGLYKWGHVKIDCYEVNTFATPVGAYRAPGAPQGCFAVEGNIDLMADKLGMDPLEFRYQNAVETGDFTGTGNPWKTTIGMKECLEAAREHPLWKNRKPGEGIGIGVGAWPNFSGNAEVTCRVDTDGRVRMETGIVDISGTKSSLVLIAAEALGVDPSMIELAQGDTTGAFGPGSGGSVVTYTMANAVHGAAEDAREQLLKLASEEFEAAPEDIEIVEGMAQVKGVPDTATSIGQLAAKGQNTTGLVPILGRGTSSPEAAGPGFVVHIIKVDVDDVSGEVRPSNYVAIQDLGLAINPMLVEGQMQGGALQSLGMGLYEGMVYENGQLLSGTFMDYCMPRIDQAPEIDAVIIEKPNPQGLYGARGMAEPPLTAGPAALAAAIRDATGVVVTYAPVRSEVLWQAMQEA